MARKFLDSRYYNYLFIRFIALLLSFLPYSFILAFGKFLGHFAYFFLKNLRKRTLSNLALATSLNLKEKELIQTAKQSFVNLAITLLEFAKWDREKNFSKRIICENFHTAEELCEKKQGVIFFCGHQANWETLFLAGNLYIKGIAIGKPIKNSYLYKWITSIREKTGGSMVEPRGAIQACLKGLKEGKFVGIVGDQGMPDSHFRTKFFGRSCFTSPIPAYLSFKTNSPIIVATVRRQKGKYYIHISDPIWPDLSQPKEKEIERLMTVSLNYLEQSIAKDKANWLWIHNRYKQKLPGQIHREFRDDALAIILPTEKNLFDKLYLHLITLHKIYKDHFVFLFVPAEYKNLKEFPKVEEITFYSDLKEVAKKDYRFKLVFNFTSENFLTRHFLRLSAQKVFSLQDLESIAKKHNPSFEKNDDFSSLFLHAILPKEKMKEFL